MKSHSFSFPRELILKKSETFKELYRQGSRLQGDLIALFYSPVEEYPFRVGFSTRKKLGNAVRRNRARRLMREVFRLHQHQVKRGVQYLFLWTGRVEGVSFREMEREMLDLLKRGGLMLRNSKSQFSRRNQKATMAKSADQNLPDGRQVPNNSPKHRELL